MGPMAARAGWRSSSWRNTSSSTSSRRCERKIRNFQQRPGGHRVRPNRSTASSMRSKSCSRSSPEAAANPTEMILEQYRRELDADKEEHEKLLAQMRESMPEHQQMLTLLRDREEKAKQIVADGRKAGPSSES